jgi:hypothetical protein
MEFWSGNNINILHLVFICMRFLYLKSIGLYTNRYADIHASRNKQTVTNTASIGTKYTYNTVIS